MQVLKLTNGGMPAAWINIEQAACLIVKNQVTWSLGENATLLAGGVRNNGLRSSLEVPAIIAVKGARESSRDVPLLTNRALFKRDGYRCMYCGGIFSIKRLTRDHVTPRGQGGEDIWMNVVSSCGDCNHKKGCRTPEQAGMPLIAPPFIPNAFEAMYLLGRNVLGEQEEYLRSRFSQNMLSAA